MPLGLADWKVEVLKILGEKIKHREEQPVTPLSPRPRNDADLTISAQPIVGKGPATNALDRMFARSAFGDDDARHCRDLGSEQLELLEERRKRNKQQKQLGTATDVSFRSSGNHSNVTLKGTFYTGNGYNLKDNEYKPDTSQPVVLFLSGSAGSAEHYGTDIAEQYQALGASVLVCDYAGFGGSDNVNVSERGLYEDAQAMLEHLVILGYRTEDIVIHGYSLGGAVAGNLEDRNEAVGNRFRGVVFDRPMTSLKEAAKEDIGTFLGSTAGHWAKNDVGSLSLKKALDRMEERDEAVDEVSPLGGRIMTADSEGLGNRARVQREARGLMGFDTHAGHDNHAAMFEAHRALFDDMLFPEDELPEDRDRDWIETQGTPMETPSPTVYELRTLFLQTFNEVQRKHDLVKLCGNHNPSEEEIEDGTWKEVCLETLEMIDEVIREIDDLKRTGLLETDTFAEQSKALEIFPVRMEGFGRMIRKRLKKHGHLDPSIDFADISRMIDKAASLQAEYEQGGGASARRKPLEDSILRLEKKLSESESLGTFLLSPRATQEEERRLIDYQLQYELLQDAVQEIKARRKAAEQRCASVQESTDRINENLRARPRENVGTRVNTEMGQRSVEGLTALFAADEDVRRKKLIGHSSDKGYKTRVTEPIEKLRPVLAKVRHGEELTDQEREQLEGLRQQLLEARTHYYEAYQAMSESKRRSSEGQQRKTKYEAIDGRLRGLGQLIDLVNSRDAVTAQIEDTRIGEVEQELRAAGVFDDFTRQLNAFTDDDPEQIQDLGRMILGLDPLTRQALLRQNNPPKGLALILQEMDIRQRETISNDLISAHAGDENSQYMLGLISETIDLEVRTQQATTLFRSNSLCSRLAGAFNRSGNGRAFINEALSGGLQAINTMDRIHDLDPQRMPEGTDVDLSFVKHHEAFEQLFDDICSTEVPDDVACVCAAMYDATLKRFGPPEMTQEEAEEMARRAAAAHLFLRVVTPVLANQCASKTDADGNPLDDDEVQRRRRNGLIQSKILMGVANECPFMEKESYMAPFNMTLQENAQKFQTLMRDVVEQGRGANGPPPELPPQQHNPRSRSTKQESQLATRLRQCVTPNDLLFELTALEIEDIRFGFSVAALTEKYTDVKELVSELQPGRFSGTRAAIEQLIRLAMRATDPGVRRVLQEKLLQPLVDQYEQRMEVAESGWRLREVTDGFDSPETFLRMVAGSPDRMSELLGLDAKSIRTMGRMVALIHNPITKESDRDAALLRLDDYLKEILHRPSREYCDRILRPQATVSVD